MAWAAVPAARAIGTARTRVAAARSSLVKVRKMAPRFHWTARDCLRWRPDRAVADVGVIRRCTPLTVKTL
ncbi:hypothetical protein GCM10010532_010800 [Dactylosporangium siamense]|uniref:Uncharacterized protein n=1 Tax=Dactylosporangium siamense TaxID=685454 RepID=A0A919PG28_9ACTN|nr:hypothetical protein Dsi01nite_009900 [Dactylosporangium siamense]